MSKVAVYTQAYNSEEYISKCIASILNQTYSDFKYYIIDNGSSDNTWEIINKFAINDKRIVPIHIDLNSRGLLNKYIEMMRDEKYLAILDSDDWYEPEFLRKMIELLEGTDSDLATCGSLFLYEESNETFLKSPSDKVVCVEKGQFGVSFPYLYSYYGALWGRIYKLKIIFENNIRFWEDVNYGRDTAFVLLYQSHCNKVAFSPDKLHNYLIRKKSDSSSFNEQALTSNENLYKHFMEYLEKINGLGEVNLTFIACVYMGLITNTNINTLLSDAASYETNMRSLYNTFHSKITNDCWNRMKDADIEIKRIMNIDSMIYEYTGILLKYICKIYNKKDNDKFYDMICFLMPLFKEMCEEDDIDYWVKNNDLLYTLMNLENNEAVFKMIDIFSDIKNSRNYWKALKNLLRKNVFLNSVENMKFVTEYPDIVKYIYSNNIESAISEIIDILTNGKENKFEEELLSICLNISAATENASLFVSIKKLQAQLYIQERRRNEAEIVMEDLTEMCPDDEDVILLKKMYGELI